MSKFNIENYKPYKPNVPYKSTSSDSNQIAAAILYLAEIIWVLGIRFLDPKHEEKKG